VGVRFWCFNIELKKKNRDTLNAKWQNDIIFCAVFHDNFDDHFPGEPALAGVY